jgi:hypothetical protein
VKKWQAYKSNHGKDSAKGTRNQLGSWIITQRRTRESLENGENSNLTQKQVYRPTELEFPRDTGIKYPKKSPKPQSWDQTFVDLSAYKVGNFIF